MTTNRGTYKNPRSTINAGATLTLVAFLMAATLQTASGQIVPKPQEAYDFDPISFTGPDPEQRFRDIKIEQKLEAQVPLHLNFTDEDGNRVALADYFGDVPVIIALVYYECPSICNEILNGMVSAFDAADNNLNLGTDYQIVTVSIDPRETPEMAKAKKANYLKQLHRPGGDIGWHFLTGEQANIETLATAVGYRYFYDEKSDLYAHDSGIIVCTPDGTVSSYMLGIRYLPASMKMALVDAGQGKIGSLVDQLVLLCYAYDPATGSYGFYIISALRLSGGLIVGALLLFWGIHFVRNTGKNAKNSKNGGSHGIPQGIPRES